MKSYYFIIILLLLSSGIYAQQDTVKHKIIKQWSLSQDFSEEVDLPFDTVFSFFHRFRTADRFSPVNVSLGNYGLPFYQFSFFDRVTDPDKFLTGNYYPFLFLPERAVFMNTQKPFSELVWSFAGPRETSEQTFRIRHSQNVNRYLNFGLIYDIIYSLGQYNYQRAENKDFTFFSSYTGNKYKLYFSAGVNNIISYENGGITDVKELENDKTREVPVKLGSLNKATSFLKNRNLLLVQRYTIGSKPVNKADTLLQQKSGFLGLSGTFSHILTLESNKRTYSDNSPQSGFYDTVFINKSVTFDSLYSRIIKNTVRFDFTTNEDRKFRLGGGVGIRNEIFKYSQIVPEKDSLLKSDTLVWNRGNNVLVGRVYNNIGDKFRWLATGELFLTGYRAGDVILNGEISKSFDWKKGRAIWLITGGLSTRQPSFWYENWGSNHFKWANDFDKEIRIDMGTRFSYPARKAELKFNYSIIDNYTDFGLDATPEQHPGGISVAAITISKDIHLWKFHLATDLILQKSSNPEIIDLPLATTRTAAYFEHLFKFKSTNGRLNLQVGADAAYNTMYHPYNYMPSTGRFYRQDQISTGNYPFVNVFLNFKVKRTRVFVMLDHLNAKLMGYKYDMIPSYPMNVRMFRYGLAWTFYD
jgi:hypothetical protein